MIAALPRVQCLRTAVVADTAVRHLRTGVEAGCRRTGVEAGTRCRPAAEASAEGVRLRTVVEAEVTHHHTVEVAVVGVLPAAEAGMPRLRAAVEATTVEAGPTAATAVGTDTTKF